MIQFLRPNSLRPSAVRSHSKLGFNVAAGLVVLVALLLSGSQGSAADERVNGAALPGSIDFVGRNLLGKAKGTFHEWRVTHIDIDRANPAAGVVEVEINIASLDTGIKRRDKDLRSAGFFDIEQFSTASVRVHGAVLKGKSERGLSLYSAKFSVRIRDVEKTLDGEFELTSEDPLTAEGSLELNRLDFGVGKAHSRWNPMSVRETVPVRFTATLAIP